jgi:LPXTG-motif cell wall-anchored protein
MAAAAGALGGGGGGSISGKNETSQEAANKTSVSGTFGNVSIGTGATNSSVWIIIALVVAGLAALFIWRKK